MKNVYIIPEMTLFPFELEDVLTVSTPTGGDDDTGVNFSTGGDGEINFSDIP